APSNWGCAGAGATRAARRRPGGGKLRRMRYRHHRIDVQSRALAGNPLGDPEDRILHVLAPETLPAGPLPVVWILPGYSGTAEAQLARDPWSPGIHQRVERLAAEGMPPALFALPDMFTSLGGCQYLSSPAVGRYEEYLWEEL